MFLYSVMFCTDCGIVLPYILIIDVADERSSAMRTVLSTTAIFLAIAFMINMGSASNSEADITKTKQRIWEATQDRG